MYPSEQEYGLFRCSNLQHEVSDGTEHLNVFYLQFEGIRDDLRANGSWTIRLQSLRTLKEKVTEKRTETYGPEQATTVNIKGG